MIYHKTISLGSNQDHFLKQTCYIYLEKEA